MRYVGVVGCILELWKVYGSYRMYMGVVEGIWEL